MNSSFTSCSTQARYASMMTMWGKFLAGALGLAAALGGWHDGAGAQVHPRDDQDAAHRGRQTGSLLSPIIIESQYVPRMLREGGTYLGFVFDSGSNIYTLKFLLNGKVIWIYVDAQSGKFLGRSGQ